MEITAVSLPLGPLRGGRVIAGEVRQVPFQVLGGANYAVSCGLRRNMRFIDSKILSVLLLLPRVLRLWTC